jgi:hypothetical protein
MSELILHIGLRKTGSSALQELLAQEAEILHEHGVDYPARLMPFPAHQELAWSVMDNVPPYVQDVPKREEVFTYYTDRISSNSAAGKSTILSSEDLSLLSLDFRAISELVSRLGIFGPRIVFYRRSPLDYLVSNYQHAVLSGRMTLSFRDYVFNVRNLTFADSRLMRQIWSNAFGRENVQVLEYDPAVFERQSVFAHFLSEVFEITLSEDPFLEYRSNTGVSAAATDYMLELNRSDQPDDVISPLKQRVRKIETSGSKQEFLERHLSADELAALRGMFG